MNLRELLFLHAASGGGGSLVENTATGNPVAFNTNVAKPLNSAVIPLSYTQSGTGDPSPSNIRPISGVSNLSAYRTGVNIFDEELEEGMLKGSTGQDSPSSSNIRSKNYISVVPGKKYYIKYTGVSGGTNMRMFSYYADKSYKGNQWVITTTFTVPSDVHYVRFYMDESYSASGDRKISINYPYTETGYVPYDGTKLDVVFPPFEDVNLRGYSALNVSYNESGSLTNNYGTSLNTISPEESVVVTQTQYTTEGSKSRYENGYFAVRLDNLVDGEKYNMSFRISNITNNPLDATLSNMRIALPNGNYIPDAIIDGDTISFNGFTYTEHTTKRTSFIIYCCGMSFTLSDFTITPSEPGTVYGGSLDLVSGVLTLTHKMQTITGEEQATYSAYSGSLYSGSDVFLSDSKSGLDIYGYCSMAPTGSINGIIHQQVLKKAYGDRGIQFYNVVEYWGLESVTQSALEAKLQEWNASGTPLQVVYELATPITVQLTPNQINAIKGNNTVWTDTTGDLTIKYLDKA